MEVLRGAYERDRKKNNAKSYIFVRKQQIGNVERNVFAKKVHHYGKTVNGRYYSPRTETVEYVKYNGKYMQLKKYKEMMKAKNLYKSPSPKAKSPIIKKCKKDCVSINKICNTKTGRCNKIKSVKAKR